MKIQRIKNTRVNVIRAEIKLAAKNYMTARNTDQLDWFTATKNSQQIHDVNCKDSRRASVCIQQKPAHMHSTKTISNICIGQVGIPTTEKPHIISDKAAKVLAVTTQHHAQAARDINGLLA